MRIIQLNKLTGNEILGKSIYDVDGRIMLSEGTPLRLAYISKLEKMGITSVYVEDEISKGIIVEENLSEKTKQAAKAHIKETVEKFITKKKDAMVGVIKSANAIMDDILSQKEVMINAMEIRNKDDMIYAHSVNVCAMATIMGTHLGYNMIRLKEIAVGALLHDIGKIKLPKDLLFKEEGWTPKEWALYSAHPREGYEILNKEMNISVISKVIALSHHEKLDGSGYPLKLKVDKIHEAVRLVSICDTFDEMTLNRKNKAKPYEAIEYLTAMSNSCYDEKIVKKFIQNVAIYPLGSGVILNTGEKAIVIKQNKGMPTRPNIRLLLDKSGKLIEGMIEIDLTQKRTLFITDVCEI